MMRNLDTTHPSSSFVSFQTDHLLEGRRCSARRCFEDTRAPSNCNEFVFRALAAKRGNGRKAAYFMRLSPQRLESPRPFSVCGRLHIFDVSAVPALVCAEFGSPRAAMSVNRYFSGVFRDRISD
jgi:hypothetical protein